MDSEKVNERIYRLECEFNKLNIDIQELTNLCQNIMSIVKREQERTDLLEETMCQICTGEMPNSSSEEANASDNNEVELSDININDSLENLAAYNANAYFSEKSTNIIDAVLSENWSEANRLAKLSGVSRYADNLEGRILQGDYTTAKMLAEQRRDEQKK